MRISLTAALLAAGAFVATAAVTPQSTCQAADGCGGWTFGSDIMFMELNRSDGFSQNVFGNETAYRLRLGYETSEGAGVRVQYWAWDHAEANGQNGNPSGADAYNLDLDMYRRVCLARGLQAEVQGGIRYSDYRDFNVADAGQSVSFAGLGGSLGVKVTQDMAFGLQGYARAKWVLMADDGNDNGTVEFDANREQHEIALGVSRPVNIGPLNLNGRAGYEWQDWGGYQDNTDGGLQFSGYVLGLDGTF